jgi:hypothetical protein
MPKKSLKRVRSKLKNTLKNNKVVYDSLPWLGSDHVPVILQKRVDGIKVMILTWNLGGVDFSNFFDGSRVRSFKPDIVVIGLQEIDKFYTVDSVADILVRNTGYTVVSKTTNCLSFFGFQIGTIILSRRQNFVAFHSSSKTPYCTRITKGYTVDTIVTRNRKKFTFINAHFPFNKISTTRGFTEELNVTINDVISEPEPQTMFVLGDLNSRSILKPLKCSDEIKNIDDESLSNGDDKDYYKLTKTLLSQRTIDYLLLRDSWNYCKELKRLTPFPKKFKEHTIHFAPSYKRNVESGDFELSKGDYGRLPGYTDRILWMKTG